MEQSSDLLKLKSLLRVSWLLTILLVTAFLLMFIITAQIPSIRAHSPWGEDPYDIIFSFAVIIAPIVYLITALRAFKIFKQNETNYTDLQYLFRGIFIILLVILVALFTCIFALILNKGHLTISTYLYLIGPLVLTELVAAAEVLLLANRHRTFIPLRPENMLNNQKRGGAFDLLDNFEFLIHREIILATVIRKYQIILVILVSIIFGLLAVIWHVLAEGPWANSNAAFVYGLFASIAPILTYLLFNKYLNILRSN
jgi:hypothetical protein